MKKLNRKGFSLVELIVVIAIMAVLVGVLAPSLLKYVEKSRIQKDASAVAEVSNAIVVAMADEDVYKATPSGSIVTITSGSAIDVTATGSGADATKLKAELASTIGTVTFSSSSATTVEIEITVTSGSVSVKAKTPASTATDDWGKAVYRASVK